MSTSFSKNKEKRSRSSSSEANTSFVKNVTARVSGFLPASITKWFSSPSSSNVNGSTQTGDTTDSSTEDETEIPVITQPPAKRMRFNTSGKYNQYGSADANCSTSSEVTENATYSSYSGTQYVQTRNTITTSPLRNPDDCETTKDHNVKDKPVYKMQTQHTVAGIGKSIANKRKSIFETSTKKEDTTKAFIKSTQSNTQDLKKPYFKPTLLGSPFYSGRTMYGGAAAASYINEPNIREHKVAVVNESKSNDDSALSSSARRVMDLLESYSSPLMEARRIPVYTRPKNDSLNFSDRFNPYGNRSISNRTQELYVPSIASILRLKKKSRLMDTTNAARQIMASHSSASNYPLYPLTPQPGRHQEKESSKMITKVKPKLTRINRGSHDELEMTTPVKLPDAVLQIDQDNLPKFSFDNSAMTKLPTTSTPKVSLAENKKNSEVSARKVETESSRTFKFSNPVRISCDTPDAVTTPKFTFDSPERQIHNNIAKNDTSLVPTKVKESESSASAAIDWQCGDCWVKNKSDIVKCLCCGGKKPKASHKCSICKVADCLPQKDKCAACVQLVPLKVSSLTTTNPIPAVESAMWKCEDCWVSNTNTDKCVCCGSKKPVSNVKPALSAVSDSGDWKCGDCWVMNKPNETKCVACGGRKPGPEAGTLAPTLSNFSKVPKSNIKQNAAPKSKWECSSCLVNNDIEKKSCVCCGSPYPKTVNEVKYSFGKGLSSFKFGFDPSKQEVTEKKTDTPVSAVVEKPKENSETNNNILNETPTFTFGIPPKKIDTNIDVPKDTTTPSFTFGLPQQSVTPNVTSNLQESAKSIEAEKEEKPQEVPSVNLKSLTEIKSLPANNLFTSSMTSKTNEEKPSPPVSTSLNLLAETSKDTVTNPISSVSTVPSVDNEKPSNTFSFGIKVKSFSSMASTSNTSNLFANPLATSVATTSASFITTPSFFPPAQTITSQSTAVFKPPESTPSLFTLVQKNEPTATSTSASPVFNFGTNISSTPAPAPSSTASSAPELDKTKFQFNFGSNTAAKTQAPVFFKSPFGSGSESNTFSLGSAASLGTAGANALGSSNGMPVANGLTVCNLPGNTMSVNGLPGNTLVPNPLTGGNNVPTNNSLGGANGLSDNSLTIGNSPQSGNTISGMFSNTVQNENVWSSGGAPATNLFVSNTSSDSLQKPTFTFGSSMPFNATTATPAFGNNPSPVTNIFGLGNQNNNQQSIFSSPVQNQPTTNIFGSPPAQSNQNQPVIFGTSNIAPTPTFGIPNTSIPSFETSSMTPAPFSFGAPQSSGIFGFGQQASAAPQAGVYSFGGAPSPGAPQVQFNMGSGASANPAVRRVRKAVRRNPQR